MKTDEQYIQKTFYKEFMKDEGGKHPIAVLGEAHLEEQQKEIADLSYIRFAQGEVYFHHKDYEAAIFKWENIHNELSGWAQKTPRMLSSNWTSSLLPKRSTSLSRQSALP
ncbi:hypothetical protein [Bacillus sp. P14.5]|uniref:hypothetical protein n=1 Tax=Bacillus sp. P14.5 TaxID=1983400 RepID=UPI000DEA765A|nr:hypothetical protein [Bacillus sp. P14.5]